MRLWLSIALAIMMAGIIVDPPDSEPYQRTFHDITCPPYSLGVAYPIVFHYRSQVAESTLLEVAFSAGPYQNVLVYSLSLARAQSFTGSFSIPAFLMNYPYGTVTFEATGYDFQFWQPLPIHAKTIVLVEDFDERDERVESIPNYALIDGDGVVYQRAESIVFKEFTHTIETPIYQRLDIETIHMVISQPDSQPIQFSNSYLLIGDPLRLLPLLPRSGDDKSARLPLAFIKEGTDYRLSLANQFYVDPITFNPSIVPIAGYVPSAYLYLPKDRYKSMRMLSLRLSFDITMHNTFRIDYETSYFSDRAMIGGCQWAAYCITTDQGDGYGIPDTVTVNHG